MSMNAVTCASLNPAISASVAGLPPGTACTLPAGAWAYACAQCLAVALNDLMSDR